MVAVVIAVIAYLLVRDTPQSCGLPPIELYKPEECTQAYSAEQEKELSTKEILFGHVFNNKPFVDYRFCQCVYLFCTLWCVRLGADVSRTGEAHGFGE